MKKFFIIAAATVFLLLFPQRSHAQMGMMGDYYHNDSSSSSQTDQQYQQNLDNLTQTLLKSQNVNSIQQLKCPKVSNDQFEKIGDAWMDVRIGNEAAHERMDQMLGGEGSQSLTNAHIQMGENYLGCNTNGTQYNWMPMMLDYQNTASKGGGFPMMGWGYGYGNGGNGFGWGFGALGLILWLVVLIDFILAGIWLWQQIRSPKKK